MATEGIAELLPELRRQRGWSRERLSHQAFGVDNDGTSAAQITAIERGARRASARTMLALAEALDVPPDFFPEYRLAVARLALDEKQVGLDRAIKALEQSSLEPTKLTKREIRSASRQGTKVDDGMSKARKTTRRVRGSK